MTTKRRDELLVGLLLLGAIVLGLGGTIWIARGGLAKGYSMYARFPWGAGLKQGQPVLLAGVQVGFVDRVELIPDGTITVTLLKTSPVNKKLSLAYNAQSQSSDTWGNNVIVIRNTASGDISTARSCAFQKQPDFNNAKEGGTVAWVFDCGKIDQLLGEF